MKQKGKVALVSLFVISFFLVAGFVFAKPDAKRPNSCSDTDGGIVLTVKGTTSGYYSNNFYSHADYCTDASNVNEYYCSGSFEYSTVASCGTDFYGANYCRNSSVYHNFTDYSCASGACGSTVTPQLLQTCQYGCTGGTCNSPPDSCSDSDGGFNVVVQGTVTGYSSGQPYSITDFCLSNITLMENYCFGTANRNASYICGNSTICITGRCA